MRNLKFRGEMQTKVTSLNVVRRKLDVSLNLQQH